jgi:hypothetical protein
MSSDDTTNGLESPRTQATLEREYLAELIGWIAITLALGAALAGWLGPGPLGFRQRRSPDRDVTVDHYAVERYAAPARLIIRFDRSGATGDEIRIAVSRSFTDHIAPESIAPEPDRVEMRPGEIVYTFRTADLGDTGRITFRHKYQAYGWLRYTVGVDGRRPAHVSQFILP